MPSGESARLHVMSDVPASDALDAIHELLDEAWAAHPDVDQLDRDLLATAIAEVAANIVTFARSESGVSLVIDVRDDVIAATFSDRGVEVPAGLVDGASMPDELAEEGRGLAMAKAALDEFSYTRDGDVNRWHLLRRRS